jgi:hypothetical protein
MVRNDHGAGGAGDYCGDNDAQLGIISVFYHEAPGGKYAPRSVLFYLELGVISALRTSLFSKLFCPGNLVNQKPGVGSNWAKGHYTKARHECFKSPFSEVAFVVNSGPTSSTRAWKFLSRKMKLN